MVNKEQNLGIDPFEGIRAQLEENRLSLHISRIPIQVKRNFVDVAHREFCGDYGMLLKYLLDLKFLVEGMITKDANVLLSKINELEERIDLTGQKEAVQSQPQIQNQIKTIRMLNGSEKKIKVEDDGGKRK